MEVVNRIINRPPVYDIFTAVMNYAKVVMLFLSFMD